MFTASSKEVEKTTHSLSSTEPPSFQRMASRNESRAMSGPAACEKHDPPGFLN